MQSFFSGSGRLAAFGRELIDMHDELRAELAQLRARVAQIVGSPGATADDAPLVRGLRGHCLTFCTALRNHHLEEDGDVFSALVAAHPELAPTVGLLRQDHQLISTLLSELETVARSAAPGLTEPVAQRLLAQLDGLRAIVESHFTFEERRIVAALDELRPA